MEVEASLKEIDRISDDTTFNTIPVLQGNPPRTDVLVKAHKAERIVTEDVYIGLPKWLDDKVDNFMKYHDGTDPSINWGGWDWSNIPPGDKDGVMYQNEYNGTSGQITGVKYYGPENSEISADYSGQDWNDKLDDNAAAVMSFKGLMEQSGIADELYNNLLQLIGAQIRFPCGTCNVQHQGIVFSGSALGLTVGDHAVTYASAEGYKYSYGAVNLSDNSFSYGGKTYKGYFNAISSMKDVGELGDTQSVKDLAGAIAKELRNKTLEAMGTGALREHFDRAIEGLDEDGYSLIVYDYRDQGLLQYNPTTESTVIKYGEVEMGRTEEYIEPAVTGIVRPPLHIMAVAVRQNWLPLNLPEISVKTLGLTDYSVAHYGKEVIGYTNSYNEQLDAYEKAMKQYEEEMKEYEKKMKEYEKEMELYRGKKDSWEKDNYEEEEVELEREVTEQKREPVYEDGELKIKVSTQKRKEKYKVVKRKLKDGINLADAPQPPTKPVEPTKPVKPAAAANEIIAKKVYAPSSLDLVDRAIDKVSAARSELGATHNALEYAYRVNAVTEENSQAAESRIRDTDIAREMVNNSKHTIMGQAAQSMQAQANQNRQNILELLSYTHE